MSTVNPAKALTAIAKDQDGPTVLDLSEDVFEIGAEIPELDLTGSIWPQREGGGFYMVHGGAGRHRKKRAYALASLLHRMRASPDPSNRAAHPVQGVLLPWRTRHNHDEQESSMNSTDEKATIEQELALIAQAGAIRQQVTDSRLERRTYEDGDAGTVQDAQQAADEARATLQATKASISAHQIALADLTADQKNGDRTITATNVRGIKDELETLQNYLGADKRTAQQTEQKLLPLIADQHLAHLAADILEGASDCPVIIRRKPSNAPDVSPAIVLSQVEATENYGTLDACGSVRITEVGETGVDWDAMQDAFEDSSCEGKVSAKSVRFDTAQWPLPRLAEPSVHGIASWMTTFEQAWGSQITGADVANQLSESGYGARAKSVFLALFHRADTDLTFGDGTAVGTSTFRVAAQASNGSSMDVPELKAELTELLSLFSQETVGGISEAGEIVSVTLSEVAGSRFAWPKNAVEWRMGGPMQPTTAEAAVTIQYAYEAA